MKIERAVREKTFTLTSIAGPSGSGKTYSAILYARGLVGPTGKIGFIDTENKRSRFYADVAGGFDVIDLDPPFTSQRYIEAIKAFEDAGYKAIIIDSISHEWEGSGGVLEQADAIEQATKRAGLHCWAKPKAAHKKLMNELLQTRAHLIFCCRVKEKVVQAKVNGKTEIVNEGFVVVQEKAFIYEMTVSMMLAEGSHIPTIQKCPGDLEFAFPVDKTLTSDVGATVAKWSDQGVAIDQDLEAAKREGLLAANSGTQALMTWWKGLGSRQAKLEGMKDTFKSIANAADQLKSDIHDAGGGDLRERLAFAQGQGTQEGFDPSFVARETEQATSGHAIEQEQQSPADPSTADDKAAEAGSDLQSSAADNTASSDAADQAGGDEAPPPVSEPSASLSDDDRAFLVRVFKTMKETVGPSIEDFEQAYRIFDGDLPSRSKLVNDKAETIRSSLIHCCGDAPKRGTLQAAKYLAGLIGVDEKELIG